MAHKLFGFICGTLLALVASSPAGPMPVNITVTSGSSPSDVVADPATVLGNFGNGTVLSWLEKDISSYDALNTTTYSSPATLFANPGQTSGAGGNSITLDIVGQTYLLLHWGGMGGGWAQAFYVGGLDGEYTFVNTNIGTGKGPSVGGLSFYSTYGTHVPDGGSTAVMLGACLSGLGLMVRRFKK